MIPATANWTNAAGAALQQPVLVLDLPGLALRYTMRAGQPGVNANNTYMKVPTGLTQQIEDLQGKATIGSITVEIVDVNRAMLPLFATTTWYGQAANLWLGFAGLTYPTDYIQIFGGIITTVVPTPDHTGWTFTLNDKNRFLRAKVYATGDDGVDPTSKNNPKTLDGNPLALVLDFLENQLGLASSAIDTGSISALENGRFQCTRMLFRLTKSVDSLSWFENELLLPNGLFHFVRYDGRIAVGDMLGVPAPVPIAFAFTDSNIVGIPGYAQKQVYNWIEVQTDYDGSAYLRNDEFLDATSITKYGLQQKLAIASQGLRSNLQGASRAGITARRIFLRYGQGPTGVISFEHPSLQASIVEVGDFVTVTSRLMEDLDTGTLGWTNRICQVVSVQPDWANGKIKFTCVDVNALASRPGPQFAPDTVPAYTSATAQQQQQYIFMANASGQQSTGAAAAEVF